MPRRTYALLLAASLFLLAANLATGHGRGALYATLAVIAFGSLLAAGIREKRATTRGPQVPLDDPVARAENQSDAARRGRGNGQDWLPAGHPDHHHDEGL